MPSKMYESVWKAGTHKNAGRPLPTGLRSQFTQILEKERSNGAGTHRFPTEIEPSMRQVVTTAEEIITQEVTKCHQEKRTLG